MLLFLLRKEKTGASASLGPSILDAQQLIQPHIWAGCRIETIPMKAYDLRVFVQGEHSEHRKRDQAPDLHGSGANACADEHLIVDRDRIHAVVICAQHCLTIYPPRPADPSPGTENEWSSSSTTVAWRRAPSVGVRRSPRR